MMDNKRKYKFTIFAIILCACFLVLCPNPTQAYEVPFFGNNSFKPYMDYKKISNKKSEQYKFQQKCSTNKQGIRVCEGKYCIALDSRLGFPISTSVYVRLDNGNTLPCIVGDLNIDNSNIQNKVIEFIVQKDKMKESVWKSGDISNYEGFEGNIIGIGTM